MASSQVGGTRVCMVQMTSVNDAFANLAQCVWFTRKAAKEVSAPRCSADARHGASDGLDANKPRLAVIAVAAGTA